MGTPAFCRRLARRSRGGFDPLEGGSKGSFDVPLPVGLRDAVLAFCVPEKKSCCATAANVVPGAFFSVYNRSRFKFVLVEGHARVFLILRHLPPPSFSVAILDASETLSFRPVHFILPFAKKRGTRGFPDQIHPVDRRKTRSSLVGGFPARLVVEPKRNETPWLLFCGGNLPGTLDQSARCIVVSRGRGREGILHMSRIRSCLTFLVDPAGLIRFCCVPPHRKNGF